MKLLTKPWFYIPLSIVSVTLATLSTIDLVKKNKKTIPTEIADLGQITDSLYTNSYLGWQFVIPEGYEILSNKLRDEGIKKILNGNYDSNSSIKLLGLKSRENKSNFLTSSLDIRSYFPDIKKTNDWYNIIKELLTKQLKNSGTTINVTKAKLIIDEVNFEIVDFTYKQNNKFVYHQKMIFKFYEDYILTITISSDNQDDLIELFEHLKKSKFLNKK